MSEVQSLSQGTGKTEYEQQYKLTGNRAYSEPAGTRGWPRRAPRGKSIYGGKDIWPKGEGHSKRRDYRYKNTSSHLSNQVIHYNEWHMMKKCREMSQICIVRPGDFIKNPRVRIKEFIMFHQGNKITRLHFIIDLPQG